MGGGSKMSLESTKMLRFYGSCPRLCSSGSEPCDGDQGARGLLGSVLGIGTWARERREVGWGRGRS